jgi:spore germination cell wall hydrolase CwlJ-like protein
MRNLILIVLSVYSLQASALKPVEFDDFICLAYNIYYEAEDQSMRGKLAVASVVVNRVPDSMYPNTVCGVVYQPSRNPRRPWACAFSWTCNRHHIAHRKVGGLAWEDSKSAARLLLSGVVKPIVPSTYYVRCGTKVTWLENTDFYTRIDDHCFYNKR